MPLSWDFFVARRRINIMQYLKEGSISSYQEMVNNLTGQGVIPPDEKKVEKYFQQLEEERQEEELSKPSTYGTSKIKKLPKASKKPRRKKASKS